MHKQNRHKRALQLRSFVPVCFFIWRRLARFGQPDASFPCDPVRFAAEKLLK
jgi:hypothetical protein